MDNLTHTAIGLFLSRIGLGRWSPGATPIVLIAANIPDIDVVSSAGGPLNYLAYHRHLTHSLLLMPVMALAAVVVVRVAGGKRETTDPSEMKIPINLASQPFRKDRAMLAASLGIGVLLVATLAALVMLANADNAQLADLRKEVTQLHAEIAAAGKQQAEFEAVIRKPENAQVLELSVFLNTLLSRKGISWTRIRSEEHTSELQSLRHLVCRLLLEK